MPRLDILHFDDPLTIDQVIFAIRPVDSFTGAIVKDPLKAEIEALGATAQRNLSGMLVFINLERRDTYDVTIKANDAGYFDASLTDIPRPANDAPDTQRIRTVPLHPLPSAPFTNETTLVRGVVHQGGKPADGVRIEAAQQGIVDPSTFTGQSDARGAFVLPLRLDPDRLIADDPPRAEFGFVFKISDQQVAEIDDQPIVDGASYRFGGPIELAEEPFVAPLFPISNF